MSQTVLALALYAHVLVQLLVEFTNLCFMILFYYYFMIFMCIRHFVSCPQLL